MLNLSFPYRSPDLMMIRRILGAKGIALQVERPSVFVCPMGPADDIPQSSVTPIFIDQDNLNWSIWADTALIDQLSDYFLSGWDDESVDRLPLTWRVLYILEVLFKYVKHPLLPKHTRIGSPCAMPRDVWKAPENIHFKIIINDFEACVVIKHGDNLAPLMQLLQFLQSAPSTESTEVKVKSKVRVYSVPLHFYDIDHLEPGDVFFISSASDDGVEAAFKVPGYKPSKSFLYYTGDVEWVSRLPPLRIEGANMKTQNTPNFDMSDEEDFLEDDFLQEGVGAEESDGDDFSDIPVKLAIEFDCGILSLSEINGMRAGSILEGVVDLHAPCTIRLSNCRMGQGRLVQVGDRIGIEIIRWKQKSLYVKQED